MHKASEFLDWVECFSPEDLRNGIKLIDESIELWKSRVYNMEMYEKANCPLCRVYADPGSDPSCINCPIKLVTGGYSCSETSFYVACYENQYDDSKINKAANFMLSELYEVRLAYIQALRTKI